jgi:acetylornithine deacetylase/succinyl-diaminopimelate desuccinylase-like protein
MAAGLITSLRDDKGRILIPGFYDDVRPLAGAEKEAIMKLPPVEDTLKREFGLGRTEGEDGLTTSTMRPAINIRGVSSGAVGADATTTIPAEARVSIDIRLVPDETPQHVRDRMEAYLKSLGWTIVSRDPDLTTRLTHAKIVKLNWGQGFPALRSDMTTSEARAVISAAEDAAGGHVALLPMMGGSVPIYLFHEILGVPVIGLPIVNHDDSQHAANENIRLKNLWDGIDTYAAMMTELNW